MDRIMEALSALCFCVAVSAVIWIYKGKLLLPGKRETIIATFSRDGEALAKWANWVAENGQQAVIITDGLTEDERKKAETAASDNVRFVSAEELMQMMGALPWQEKTSSK